MRTVYYIIAPTSSGKTTAARALSAEMNLPLFHADLVYNELAKKYNAACSPAKLTQYELWNKPEEFGIESWGVHATMHGAKREIYCDLLKNASGDFIIEGFTLSFASERELVTDAIGAHRAVLLRIMLPFVLWRNFFTHKFPTLKAPGEAIFDRLSGVFEVMDDDLSLTFLHPEEITAQNVLMRSVVESSSGKVSMETDMFVTEKAFLGRAKELAESDPRDKNNNSVAYWKDADARWSYYRRIIEIMKPRFTAESTSLELGTMGIPVVMNSQQMDYDKHLSYYGERQPEVIHDARSIPWPMKSKQFDWFIACRVYHHLWPVQRECFEEAFRIARNVILIVPETLPPGGGAVILPEQFRGWLSDVRPSIIEPVGRFGLLYAWFE